MRLLMALARGLYSIWLTDTYVYTGVTLHLFFFSLQQTREKIHSYNLAGSLPSDVKIFYITVCAY